MSAAASDNATITLSLSGNATLGADYSLSDNITIIAGQTSGNATLTGLNDNAYEGAEQIVVDIAAISGGDNASENGTQQVSVTIVDDDSAGVAVANFRATSGQNRITLNWDALSGADNYTIYWKTSSGVTVGDS